MQLIARTLRFTLAAALSHGAMSAYAADDFSWMAEDSAPRVDVFLGAANGQEKSSLSKKNTTVETVKPDPRAKQFNDNRLVIVVERPKPITRTAPILASTRATPTRSLDYHFDRYALKYFGSAEYSALFKAQAHVESDMRPRAVSSAGARGIMQIMPATFGEIRRSIKVPNAIFDPHTNIKAGIYYNKKLYDAWSHIPNENDRVRLMLASYNAGLGRVKRALKRAGSPRVYAPVEAYLPAETRRYVQKITRRHPLDDSRLTIR